MSRRVGSVTTLDGLAVGIEVDHALPRLGELLYIHGKENLPLIVDKVNGTNNVIALNILDDKRIVQGDVIHSDGKELELPVGDQIFGRVFNAIGETIDGPGLIDPPTTNVSINQNAKIGTIQIPVLMETGIKVIDFLAPFVKGRRTGIIGGAGVGKTVLTTELIRNVANNDAALSFFVGIGERIREGHELHETLKERGLSDNTVMFLGQMNENAALRSMVGPSAAAVARHFAREGKDILFFVDNVYRFVQARNELSTMQGVIPSEGGYQASLFSDLHRFEDSLNSPIGGTITSVQSIYIPADDLTDPAVVEISQQLDSVIVLSREVFETGIYPAVDLMTTTSTLLIPQIVGQRHYNLAQKAKAVMRQYYSLRTITAIVGESELSSDDLAAYLQAQKLVAYFSQNMFVTEDLSGKPGEYIPREQMLNEVEKILTL